AVEIRVYCLLCLCFRNDQSQQRSESVVFCIGRLHSVRLDSKSQTGSPVPSRPSYLRMGSFHRNKSNHWMDIKGKGFLYEDDDEPIKLTDQDTSQNITEFQLSLIGKILNPKKKMLRSFFRKCHHNGAWRTALPLTTWAMEIFFYDLNSVLLHGPFHFKFCMFVLVRWEPIVHDDYPWIIPFWTRLIGVPLHLWTGNNLKGIGSRLGHDTSAGEPPWRLYTGSVITSLGTSMIRDMAIVKGGMIRSLLPHVTKAEVMLIGSFDVGVISLGAADMVPSAPISNDSRIHERKSSERKSTWEAQGTRRLASTIVTPSRIDHDMDENVTKRSKGSHRYLTFSTLSAKELMPVDGDDLIIDALNDMDIAEQQDGGMMDCEVQNDDLMGLELAEMEDKAVQDVTHKSQKPAVKASKGSKYGSKPSAPLGIQNKKIEILLRGSPHKRSSSSHETRTAGILVDT
ncbi:hypothetical protein HID58_054206, partial [Brassica napus]